MKILVTGSAGFIGFHLVGALLRDENEVVGIDNINDYYDVRLKYARLSQCGIHKEAITENRLVKSERYPAYRFQPLDLTDLVGLDTLFETERFDVVVNLAAQAGVRYSIENPYAYVQSNLVGFVNILECCRHYKIKHLVYASSSSVYGMNNKIPFSEDDRVDFPVSLYAATKKSNELMAHTYSHLYQLPTTGLRFFTVYGPWGRPDMSPMIFAKAIVEGTQIRVFNHGDMQRDFTYIDDIIAGVVRVIDYIPDHKEEHPCYRIFNIGNSRPVKLMDFIHSLETALGKTALLEMCPMQPGDVKITYADTTRLEQETGYRPSHVLDAGGLSEFISWYKNDYLSITKDS